MACRYERPPADLLHQAIAMCLMDGVGLRMLRRGLKRVAWLAALIAFAGPIAFLLAGVAGVLVPAAVAIGGYFTLAGVLPMVGLLLLYHAPPPMLMAFQRHRATAVPATWLRLLLGPTRSSLERPPRSFAFGR